MPTYDYKCPSCDNSFEKFHGISENPEVLCTSCGVVTVRQISFGGGIVFKGSGFYVNDYKNNSSSTSSKSEVVSSASSSCSTGTCGCG